MREQELNFYFTDISYIKGVGPKSAALLTNLFTGKDSVQVKDLLFHRPVHAIERVIVTELTQELVGQDIIIEIEVIDHQNPARYRKGRAPKRILCSAGGESFAIVNFNIPDAALKAAYPVGSKRIVAGKLELFDNTYQIVHPVLNIDVARKNELRKIEPIYPLTAGITGKYLNKILNSIFEKLPKLNEWQNVDFIKGMEFSSFNDSLHRIHNPQSVGDVFLYSKFRQRLAYDELLADQLAINLSRARVKKVKGTQIKIDEHLEKKLLDKLPFELTNGQISALNELKKDITSGERMFRLLQGDVGSGKTITALITMLHAVNSGLQTVIMAPTEILAQQHFSSITKMLENAGFNIEIGLLTGSVKGKAREKIYSEIESGTTQILIGTHALFQETVKFKNLGLMVVDEQHRFGVKQRMMLAEKGVGVHMLMMSATPIPRTLSLTIYGDMDISIISEKPKNRKPIATALVPLSREDEVVESIKRKLEAGEQIYWICPLIDEIEQNFDIENDMSHLAAATERFKKLQKIFGDDVALMHGQMKPAEKDKVMRDFKDHKSKILVSTTVVEVGVDVPNATVIIIENAEKFGLSQLHQLRGRVGRGDKQSSCVLLYSNKVSESSKKRLQVIRDTEDGFKIAEEDLILRGSGELIGTKQSGLPEYNFALLPEHKDLLFAARDDVKYIISTDETLQTERGKNLRNLLYLFEYDKHLKNFKA